MTIIKKDKMKILNSYLNGNVRVTLFDNGTKIQEWDGDDYSDAMPEFPNSMDVKITNYCDLGCAFCHEKSTKHGKHADLDYLLKILKDLPKGTELAIGGGNPLDHPHLYDFLSKCKELGLICNMTMNYLHLNKYIDLVNKLIDEQLIMGLGLSISGRTNIDDVNKINNVSNVVFHVISGVQSVSILDLIYESPIKKVLILGYKQFGRGEQYYNENVKEAEEVWHTQITKYFDKLQLTFDDLGAKQFSVKQYFPEDVWRTLFTGFDGQFTMYVDAVNKQYAVSSTGKARFNLNKPIKDCFKHVRKISGHE